ncbi:MAG: secretin N-terminal domain-containing protein [Parachlamydiales bacterium]
MRRKLLTLFGILPLIAASSATHAPAPVWRIETPQALKDHYRDLLEPLTRPSPSPDERAQLEKARELLIRNSTEKPPVLVKTIGGREIPPQEAEGPAQEFTYPDSETYIINFNNIEISQYLRFVAQIARTSFVYQEEDLKFRVTILSESPATVEQVISVLLQILQASGLHIAEQGGRILITKEKSLAKLSEVVSDADVDELSSSHPLVTRVFGIQNGSPEGLEKVVAPLLSDAALVQTSPETGHLIVTDIIGNVERVGKLLESLQVPPSAPSRVEITPYIIRSGSIEQVILLATRSLESLGIHGISLIPQVSTNTIYIVGTPDDTAVASRVLETIDGASVGVEVPQIPIGIAQEKEQRRSDLTGTTFYIYKLQYHQGNDIVDALHEIAASLEAAKNPEEALVTAIRTIQWVRTSNSLVISGLPSAIEKVRQLIQDLDIELEQVLIETLVLRTTVANALTIGVEWGAKATFDDPTKINDTVLQFGAGSTTPPNPLTGTATSFLNSALTPLIPPPAIPLPGGAGIGAVGRFVSLGGKLFYSLGAIINALQQDSHTSILFNPKIMTQDGHTARLFVGQNVAFIEDTVSEPGSTILTGALKYRNVGTELIVTPILGTGDMVTLDITQDISRLTDTATASTTGGNPGTSQPTERSTTSTRVTVPDGYFVVISGQIGDTQMKIHRGLPCLGGLPVIGTCFSVKDEADSRDNLIIVLRPHILRSKADMVRMSERERAHYEKSSWQRCFRMTKQEIAELLNCTPTDVSRHDHYYDPCYEHEGTVCYD